MSTTLTKADRFRGDLWNTTGSQRERILRDMYDGSAFTVSTVHRLGSGLYVQVTFSDGVTTTISYDTIRSHVWDVTR